MNRGVKILVAIVGGLVLLVLIGMVLCTVLSAPVRSSGPEPEATAEPGGAGLANPAAAYCEEQGGGWRSAQPLMVGNTVSASLPMAANVTSGPSIGASAVQGTRRADYPSGSRE